MKEDNLVGYNVQIDSSSSRGMICLFDHLCDLTSSSSFVLVKVK